MKTKEQLKRVWAWYALAAGLILLDQMVKNLVRATMFLGQSRPFLPGVLELYYVENTGGAFSILESYTWILAALSAAVTVALVLCLWKNWLAEGPFSRLCVTLVLSGAAGNLIDRVFRGRVTDMFNFTFITFGVFNVADICVVLGVIGYTVYVLYTQYTQYTQHKHRPEQENHEADRP